MAENKQDFIYLILCDGVNPVTIENFFLYIFKVSLSQLTTNAGLAIPNAYCCEFKGTRIGLDMLSINSELKPQPERVHLCTGY